MSTRAFAFIDGASFETNIDPMLGELGTNFREVDWRALTRNADRVFYFDALPVRKPNQTDEDFNQNLETKRERLSFLRRQPNLHVREGLTRARKNSGTPVLQQKGVDVALAVEVMMHAFQGTIDTARLFLNDLDFYPLLDLLTNTRVKSELYYVASKTSEEMISAADISEEVNHNWLYPSLPEPVRSMCGPSGISEDYSHFSLRKLGRNRFGIVRLLSSQDGSRFVLEALSGPGSQFVHMGRSKEVLVQHLEASIREKVVWENS
jgi:hypothetical protein